MAEQRAAGFGPDVLTLELASNGHAEAGAEAASSGGTGLLLAAPKARLAGETEMDFYRRKQNTVTVRHASGDRVVAVVEIVSAGNKSSQHALRGFVQKAPDLFDQGIHLLVVDVYPPGPRDPQGVHGTIWLESTGQEYELPPQKPLTLAAYEADLALRAYVEHLAVGDGLIDMPLFLRPRAHIELPLEKTYQAAYAAVSRRWQRVLDGA
jgi:hypothetical protein